MARTYNNIENIFKERFKGILTNCNITQADFRVGFLPEWLGKYYQRNRQPTERLCV
jgi:hypothetical protein